MVDACAHAHASGGGSSPPVSSSSSWRACAISRIALLLTTGSYRSLITPVLINPSAPPSLSLPLSFLDILDADAEVARAITERPLSALPILDEAAAKAIKLLCAELRAAALSTTNRAIHLQENLRLRIRPVGLACSADEPLTNANLASLRGDRAGSLVRLKGTVTRTGSVQMLEAQVYFQCTTCKHTFVLTPMLELNYAVEAPTTCPSEQGRRAKPCSGRNFEKVMPPHDDGSQGSQEPPHRDLQEIRMQVASGSAHDSEQIKSVGGESSAASRSVTVILEDDLADSAQAGEAVCVCGVLRRRWGRLYNGCRPEVELVVQAISLEPLDGRRITQDEANADAVHAREVRRMNAYGAYWEGAQPLRQRDRLLASVCPQLYGMRAAKLAVVLAVVGGARTDTSAAAERGGDSSSATRADVHVLFVGDPGTGKSQLLRTAALLAPRAVSASGLASSAAGLTACATRDEKGRGGGFVLEAGALVLADGGVCCLDELDAIKPQDRASVHEAMEQQTVSVAKAGITARLPSRCAVVACCNPRGHFDPNTSLELNTGLSSPLLSRFDVVLVLVDSADEAWDRRVAARIAAAHGCHTLEHAIASATSPNDVGAPFAAIAAQAPAAVTEEEEELDAMGFTVGAAYTDQAAPPSSADAPWSFASLKAYVLHVRNAAAPLLAPEAEKVLSAYYTHRRRLDSGVGIGGGLGTLDASEFYGGGGGGGGSRGVGESSRVTVRTLESLLRLTQAHAKLRFASEATLMDAVEAIRLVDVASSDPLVANAALPREPFPVDADAEHAQYRDAILRKL